MLLRPFNFLLLDEPTNHLDMLSKDVLKQALADYNGTLLVVSHDREFLSGMTNRTIEFRDGHLKEYLGDVNYFLEKRKLDNMRDVEKRSAAGAGSRSSDNGVQVLGSEEKKMLQRTVQKAEKRISELEVEIGKWEKKMEDPDFYNKPDSGESIRQYNNLKNELDTVYNEWETALEKLG
jgi:ATP-binding cassette subfamily F protein 3